MNMGGAISWVEAHPWESAAIGGGSVLILLWVFGVFGSHASASSAGASNLASAYYAAEAQQAVVGGQIQQATIAAASQTAIAGMQANAAVQVNAANAGAAQTINGQNTGAAMTINAAQTQAATDQARIAAGVSVAQSSDQLQATWSNNAALVADTANNNTTAATINAANNNASLFQILLGQLMPAELATSQATGSATVLNIPGLGNFEAQARTPWDVGALAASGYSPDQIRQATGL